MDNNVYVHMFGSADKHDKMIEIEQHLKEACKLLEEIGESTYEKVIKLGSTYSVKIKS